jgi:hypothetical protein
MESKRHRLKSCGTPLTKRHPIPHTDDSPPPARQQGHQRYGRPVAQQDPEQFLQKTSRHEPRDRRTHFASGGCRVAYFHSRVDEPAKRKSAECGFVLCQICATPSISRSLGTGFKLIMYWVLEVSFSFFAFISRCRRTGSLYVTLHLSDGRFYLLFIVARLGFNVVYYQSRIR